MTAAAVEAVRAALPTARIDVVLEPSTGAAALWAGWPVHQAIGETAMAGLMAGADFAVGAGGTSTWERCAVGLPTVVFRGRQTKTNARRLDDRAQRDAGSADGCGRRRFVV